MAETAIPLRLNFKKDRHLEIEWADGLRSIYPVGYLRKMCPCATCRDAREEQERKKASKSLSLNVLGSAGSDGPLVATDAKMVGNYAIQITFSDSHDTGIYSFSYLREISPKPASDRHPEV